MTNTAHAPSFTAARLFRRTSAKGGTYFTGRMGGVKVALLKSKDVADDGGEIWNLVFAEAAPFMPKTQDAGKSSANNTPDAEPKTETRPRAQSRPQRDAAAKRDWQRPPPPSAGRVPSGPDHEIPF